MGKDEIIESDNNQIEQQSEELVNQIVDDLTLFDDDLMSLVFDKKYSCNATCTQNYFQSCH